MENKEIKIPYARDDGFNPSVKCDNPIIEKWVHKDVVKMTGDSEDDFIIEQKPVKIDEINIQKSIDEEAKTTDLKYLLKQFLLTGDESYINRKPGFYGDVTGVQDAMEGQGYVTPDQIKNTLPDELKGLTVEEIAQMSDKDIIEYFNKVRKESTVEETVKETVEETEKGNNE